MTSQKDENSKSLTLQAVDEICHSRIVYAMSFVVPFIILIAVYIMHKIHPFGNSMYLRSDMYHQYAPFFSNLWDKIRHGGSIQYSWDIGMGSNFLSLYGYYLSSPINWFVALFPQKIITDVMDFIILIKIALSSLTFTIYICNHKKEKNVTAAIFGMFYALSAYTTAFSWNLMWLDCIVLLPLIILGIEKLVYEKKGLLYSITLGLAILSNYYIAIMICMSLVLYFIVLTISRPVPEKKSEYGKSILRFAGYSLLAGALSAVLILPELAAVKYTDSSGIDFPKAWQRYFSFVSMFKLHLMEVDVQLSNDHYPNVYCGVAILLLVPLYIMTKNVSKREKFGRFILLFIFLTGFNFNITNFIWHGFHFPRSLPCRQSFIYIFLLLTMCYDAAKEMHEYKNKQISGSICFALLFLIYLGDSLQEKDIINYNSIYLSAIFIAIYAMFFFIIRHFKKFTSYLLIAVFAVSIIEVTMHTEKAGYSVTPRPDYYADYDTVKALMNEVDANDSSFYRISKLRGYRSKNDATWHNFHSPSTFSSTAYAGINDFYAQLGLEHSTNAYAINGATPIVYSLFNVKYLLTNKSMEENELFTYYAKEGNEYLYKNEYALPLGYMVPSDLDENIMYDTEPNPFNVQNNFLTYSTGIDHVMTPIDIFDDGITTTIHVDSDSYIYGYVRTTAVETVSADIDGVSQRFTGVNHGRGIDIGFVKAGTTITLSDAASSNKKPLQLLAYSVNVEKYKEAMTKLSEQGLDVTKYDDTHVYGTITANEDGLMFTSVPYDKSWTVYVDGVKTDFTQIGKAFIAVPLTAGTHEIKMVFVAENFKPGLVITILSAIIIAMLIVFRKKFKKELTEDGAIDDFIVAIRNKKSKPDKTESEETAK